MPRKKAADPAATDVTLTTSPDTEITLEASPAPSSGGGAGPSSGIMNAIKENPVPAGMVWLGLGWLVLSRSGVKPLQAAAAQETVSGVATKTQETVGGVASGAQERARGAAGRARGAAGRARAAATTARFVATSAASAARERATTGAARARSEAQRLVTEKPMALEMAAVAAGAVAGLALPETKPEREMLRPAREQVKEKLQSVGEQAVTKVEGLVDQSQQQYPT